MLAPCGLGDKPSNKAMICETCDLYWFVITIHWWFINILFISIYLPYKMGTELLWMLVNLSCRDGVFVNCVSACLMHSVASLIEFDYCESKNLYMFLCISYNHAIHLRFSCACFRSLPRSRHFWLPNAAGSDMRQHLMWFDVLCSIVPCVDPCNTFGKVWMGWVVHL